MPLVDSHCALEFVHIDFVNLLILIIFKENILIIQIKLNNSRRKISKKKNYEIIF